MLGVSELKVIILLLKITGGLLLREEEAKYLSISKTMSIIIQRTQFILIQQWTCTFHKDQGSL